MLLRERNSLRSTMLLIQKRKKLLLGHIGLNMLKLFLKKPANTMLNVDDSAVLTEGGGMN